MLVLSRRKDEAIVIENGRIRIIVVAIQGDKVKIGIEADKSITIHREEVQLHLDQLAAIEHPDVPE